MVALLSIYSLFVFHNFLFRSKQVQGSNSLGSEVNRSDKGSSTCVMQPSIGSKWPKTLKQMADRWNRWKVVSSCTTNGLRRSIPWSPGTTGFATGFATSNHLRQNSFNFKVNQKWCRKSKCSSNLWLHFFYCFFLWFSHPTLRQVGTVRVELGGPAGRKKRASWPALPRGTRPRRCLALPIRSGGLFVYFFCVFGMVWNSKRWFSRFKKLAKKKTWLTWLFGFQTLVKMRLIEDGHLSEHSRHLLGPAARLAMPHGGLHHLLTYLEHQPANISDSFFCLALSCKKASLESFWTRPAQLGW